MCTNGKLMGLHFSSSQLLLNVCKLFKTEKYPTILIITATIIIVKNISNPYLVLKVASVYISSIILIFLSFFTLLLFSFFFFHILNYVNKLIILLYFKML